MSQLTGAALLFKNAILDFIFPPICVLCEKRVEDFKNSLCEKCIAHLPKLKYPSVSAKFINPEPPVNFDKSVAVFQYQDSVKELIHKIKYENMTSLLHPLSQVFFADNIVKNVPVDIIVPVPLYSNKEKKRGFNQAELLAQNICDFWPRAQIMNVIDRVKNTRTQTKMTRSERIENVKDAFRLNCDADFSNKTILLVDDVLTTGSTINECAWELKKAHPKQIIALTLARVDLV